MLNVMLNMKLISQLVMVNANDNDENIPWCNMIHNVCFGFATRKGSGVVRSEWQLSQFVFDPYHGLSLMIMILSMKPFNGTLF